MGKIRPDRFKEFTDLVVNPNWIAQVIMVYLRWGGLHKAFVCSQISCKRSFSSFGFLIRKLRILLEDCCETTLIVRIFSLKLTTCKTFFTTLSSFLCNYRKIGCTISRIQSVHVFQNLQSGISFPTFQ